MADRTIDGDLPESREPKRNLLDLRCRHAAELISESMDTPPRVFERWALGLHILLCRACRLYAQQLDFLRRAHRRAADEEVDDSAPRTHLPPDLRLRIITRLEEELDAG